MQTKGAETNEECSPKSCISKLGKMWIYMRIFNQNFKYFSQIKWKNNLRFKFAVSLDMMPKELASISARE
jgi:hypothetical protein